jgi:alpha-L-fucosidase
VPNDVYKPTNEIIEKLVDIVSKGGNYLLNIGPSPEGELDAVAYSRLKEIGAWMKTNGEAIYGTRMYDTFGEGANIRFTQSKDKKTQYVFLFDFPENGKINLSKMPISSKSTLKMLGINQILHHSKTTEGIEITLPASAKSASEHVWVIKVTQP